MHKGIEKSYSSSIVYKRIFSFVILNFINYLEKKTLGYVQNSEIMKISIDLRIIIKVPIYLCKTGYF